MRFLNLLFCCCLFIVSFKVKSQHTVPIYFTKVSNDIVFEHYEKEDLPPYFETFIFEEDSLRNFLRCVTTGDILDGYLIVPLLHGKTDTVKIYQSRSVHPQNFQHSDEIIFVTGHETLSGKRVYFVGSGYKHTLKFDISERFTDNKRTTWIERKYDCNCFIVYDHLPLKQLEAIKEARKNWRCYTK